LSEDTVTTQPSVFTTQMVSVEPGSRWTTDMCDCCDDCGICCCALWCIPCMMCNTASEFGECLCLPLMDPMCMGYVGCSIKGSICDDSMAREIKRRGN
uniref:Uncharacterized protein n=1 Tax=Leptobrachium leishanense TaxID=445787 RepID=A0A8C5MRE1_9ANUR